MPGLITKRGQKRWRGSVTVTGATRQKLFPDDSKKSFKAAVGWEIEARKDLEEELSRTATDCWDLLSWPEKYLDYVQERFSKKTYQEKRSGFTRLLSEFPAELPVDNLSVSDCLQYLSKQAKSRSGHAANKDRKNFAAAWEWGRKYLDGWPERRNPFRVVDKFPEERSPRYIPPEEDFWKIYNVAKGQDKVMLLACLHLAARRGEIFNLTWSDVDFGNNRIRLWTRKREGGHKESDWLPMTSELRKALARWWDERPIKDTVCVFVCLQKLPFCEEYYGKPFTVRQHFMKRLCESAEVKPFGFHAVRHLTASILYRKGYSVAHIQAVLRHKNPNTTSRYLRTLGLEQIREALEEGLKRPAKVIQLKKKTPGEVSSEG